MRESDIEDYLSMRVKECGGEVRKVNWVGRRGAPDRRVMLRFKCTWIELKRPGGELEDHQHREHERMRRLGETVEVLDSKDSIDRWLEGFFKYDPN